MIYIDHETNIHGIYIMAQMFMAYCEQKKN